MSQPETVAGPERLAVPPADAPAAKTLSGAEALAWGVLAAQVGLMTGYPGSPATAVYDAVVARGEGGPVAYWAPNEKAAVEVALGASLAGTRSLVVLKSVGLNIALDPLATAAYCGCHAGMVILLGDDPGGWSSQNEQDSRWLARAAELPLVEPVDVEDAASFMVQAFAWAEAIGLPVIVRVTPSLVARRAVAAPPWELPPSHKRFARKEDRWVVLPATVVARRRTLHRKLRLMRHSLDASPYDRAALRGSLGIVAVGAAHAKVVAALGAALDDYSLLALTSVYPLPEEALKLWLRRCPRVLVLEEGGPFVEHHLRALAQRARLPVHIAGRDDHVLPEEGELTGRDIVAAVRQFDEALDLPAQPAVAREMPSTAGLCDGCQYAPAFEALAVAMERTGGRRRYLLTGETGCMVRAHGTAALRLDVKLSLGAALGLAVGLAEANERQRLVALVGDSCFYHSEMNVLPLAVDRGLDLTVVVLDNGVTGLTGGQPHPGTGAQGRAARLAAFCRAAGVEPGLAAATDRDALVRALTTALKSPGVSVVVVRAPCVRYGTVEVE